VSKQAVFEEVRRERQDSEHAQSAIQETIRESEPVIEANTKELFIVKEAPFDHTIVTET